MIYEEALKKLENAGQTQLLKYFDSLSESDKAKLLDQIDRTDFSVLGYLKNKDKAAERGVFSPLKAMELEEIGSRRDEFKKTGMSAIKSGKVAACLLAGGMGTRLGSDGPKGIYNIGLTKDVFIFQRLIENLMDVTSECKEYIRLFIMTSEKNHDETVSFLKEHDYFGYPEEKITFFMQDMAPACDKNGKVYLESSCEIATSPNGNAGWYRSMCSAGLDEILLKENIEWINIFAVDNVLQRIADPVFVGAVVLNDADCGSKVVKKAAPDENVGVMCLEDGRPSIVEYYEESEEMRNAVDDNGNPAYNFGVILNYLFKVSSLREIVKNDLPMHVVSKKISYLDEEGNLIKPKEPNGYKFEQLVLDMIHALDSCLAFEVIREKEFAPIKNAKGTDSVETARALCKKNGIEL